MNKIPYEERCKTYMNALITYGDRHQMIKCLEEMGECIQTICKVLNGGENYDHLAEEIADVTVTMEQMRLLFNINDRVCEYMDAKVARLDADLKKRAITDRPYDNNSGPEIGNCPSGSVITGR